MPDAVESITALKEESVLDIERITKDRLVDMRDRVTDEQ